MIKYFLLIIFLFGLIACSKEEAPVVSQFGNRLVPPSNNNVKKARERRENLSSTKPIEKLQAQRLKDAKSKSVKSPSPSVEATTPTVLPTLNASAIFQPTDLIVPLYGRGVVWSINPNKYIPRDVVNCPKNRIDSFCMGKDYRVIQRIFGQPAKATQDTWSYNNMKVKYLAGGGRHSVVHIKFLEGKVCRVTTTP